MAGKQFLFANNKTETPKEELIIAHLPLVKQIVGRLLVKLPNHLDKEDLISFGVLGLIDAVEKFKPELSVKFSSYAYTRIKGSIYDEIRKNSIVPRTVMQQIKEYTKIQSELENSQGTEASIKEIAQQMEIKEEELGKMLQHVNMFSMTSLDELLEIGEGDTGRVELIEDKKAVNPLNQIEESHEAEVLSVAIESLEERDKLILSLYYYEELTLLEIGEILGVSESRVCQLHARSLIRLRDKLTKLNYERTI